MSPLVALLDVSLQNVRGLASLSAQGDTTLWYVTRAAAISAYALLALTAMLGLLRSLARATAVRTAWFIGALDDLHQFCALLAAAFTTLHLGTLLVDSYIHFTPVNLLLPFGEPYKPLGSGLGVLALYALATVLLSSWLRRRFSYRAWRALHYTSFAAFVLVTAHGLLAGSDMGTNWMRTLYLGAAGGVALLVVLRMLVGSPRHSAKPRPAARQASR